MGSICSSPEDGQIEEHPGSSPLVLWGDVQQSETRVVMTLLYLAKIKYEFQQVTIPVSTGPGNVSQLPKKEDYLEMNEAKPIQNLVEGRSIYIGQRDSFFTYIANYKEDISVQLLPKFPQTTADRVKQCLDWHESILQPAVLRLVTAQRKVWLYKAQRQRETKLNQNSLLGGLTSEQLVIFEQKLSLALFEIKKYILPAIEEQLRGRAYFCSDK